MKSKIVHTKTIAAIFLEWFIIGITIFLVIHNWNFINIFIAIIIIGSRQHALFILYHDAVHYLISSKKRLNDFITNATIGVPLLLPVHIYRSLHLCHHQYLGSKNDPERLFLYKNQDWQYSSLPALKLLRQFFLDMFLFNNIRMSVYYFLAKNDRTLKLSLFKSRSFPETYLLFSILFILNFLLSITDFNLWLKFMTLWLLPLLTVTQFLQKIRSFTEHNGQSCDVLTNSWKTGPISRFFIWPYNINYHREHHQKPWITWDQLPNQLCGNQQRKSKTLLNYLYNGNLV